MRPHSLRLGLLLGLAVCVHTFRGAAQLGPRAPPSTRRPSTRERDVDLSETVKRLASEEQARAAASLFAKSLTPAKTPAKKPARGKNPVVVGAVDEKHATVDRRRMGRRGSSTDALFSTVLLDVDQERTLGALTVELARLEAARDALLEEEGAGPLGERDLLGDNELEDELLGLSCDAFRARWAARAGLASEQELTRRIRDGRAARQALVAANMRLVVAVAKRYANLGMGLSDLVQEGSLGLMRAATKYDPARGCKFGTYACWWIQQAILRAVAFQSRLIRLPMHVHQDLARATRAAREFSQAHGRDPSDDELAALLDMTPAKLRKVRTAARQGDAVSTETPRGKEAKVGSVEAQFGSRGGSGKRDQKAPSPPPRAAGRQLKLEDTLEAREPGADRAVEMSLLHGAIREAFQDLDRDEQRVVALRYGLGDGQARTPAQVARACGQSKDWVRRCEMRAIRKLRKPHHLMSLRPYNQQRQSLTQRPEA